MFKETSTLRAASLKADAVVDMTQVRGGQFQRGIVASCRR
jgi:hypothetical protein